MSIIIEPKYNGMRIVIHRKDNEVRCYTEDKLRDRSEIFDRIVDEVLTLPVKRFVIDCEFVEWVNDKPAPRESFMWMIVGKEPMGDRDVRVNVHDVLWWDEKAINELSYRERLKYLDKLLPEDLKYLRKTLWWEITNRKEFDEALKKAYAYPGSEGSLLKSSDSQYLPGVARTVDWCVYDDTKILTPDGYVHAHELKVGDFVFSKDGQQHAIKRIAKRRLSDYDKLYSITDPADDTHFFITGNHEMLIGENQWKSVEELEGNIVSVPNCDSKKKLIFVENRAGFFEIAKKLYYFYDFEIDGEDSYCTPECILHNSKIKIVKEISCKIVGRMKKAMPFETIGRDQPKEDITGEEALKLYKRLQEKSNTWIFRCALKDGKEYVTIDTEDTVTKSDLEVKWNSKLSKPKWQGLDNPELWEMLKGFEHRETGAQSYGATYAKSFDIDPKLGMIVTVAPVQVIQFEGESGKQYLSWMFPKVRELKPESHEPDDLKDIKRLIEIRKIADIDDYDASEANDKQLRDDYRLALAFYSTWKTNPNAIKFSREQIKNVLIKIVRELVERGPDVIQFSPAKMKPSSQEIFNEIRSKIEIPANMIAED